MALGTTLPFGLRDIRLTPYTDLTATILGTSLDLPNARTLTFAEVEDFQELRGDDSVVATHGNGPGVEWELEGGGVSLEAVATMYGGTVATTGVTPNQIKSLTKKITDQRPYFKIEGQSISDNGGDFHQVIYRAKATDNLTGEQADGDWFLTGASGIGMKSLVIADLDKVWAWVQNETITPSV
jgi:hypothetical protein